MSTRNRNILILILSLAIGGGFFYYVLNFNKGVANKSIAFKDFVAQDVDGYALLQLEKSLPLIREELANFEGGAFVALGMNQLVNTELNVIDKEAGLMTVLYADSTNPSFLIFAQLKDSLVDLQQSGFVYKKSLYADRLHIGQYKNLLFMHASKEAIGMDDAVAKCNAYILQNKYNHMDFGTELFSGKLFAEASALTKDLPKIDSLIFSTSFDQKMFLEPYKNGKGLSTYFNSISYSSVDSLMNEMAIHTEPNELYRLAIETEKLQKLFAKAEKVGFDMEMLKNAWNGQFVFNDLGSQVIVNEFITYEMDDEFNTIEVVKRNEKQVKAFSCFVGTKADVAASMIQDLESKKIIKKSGDHYVLLNMFDAEINIFPIEGKGLFVSNFENSANASRYYDSGSNSNSFVKMERFGKKLRLIFNDRIELRYE